MAQANNTFYCDVNAEPLERYRKGGYHPTHLDDHFKDGRYRIIHKLGWGAYATVWLAKDMLLGRHIALKILVARRSRDDHEVRIMDRLSQGPASHGGKKHVIQLLDHFRHEGPNGMHLCLVLELLGPSILSKAESYSTNRLPGDIAWEASKQIVHGLTYIHALGIVHGDLHPGNVLFTITAQYDMSDTDLLTSLGKPRNADVVPTNGTSLHPQVPKYLVSPTSLPILAQKVRPVMVKIVDFGEAFLQGHESNVHTPLIFQAPETIFDTRQDLRTDIWSLACTIFELIVGHPPFENIMPNRHDLIREWVSMLGDLPPGWEEHLPPRQPKKNLETKPCTLPEWLHTTYFEDEKSTYFTEAEIQAAGDLLQSMMRYRPSSRPRACQILNHRWFRNSRSEKQEVRGFKDAGS